MPQQRNVQQAIMALALIWKLSKTYKVLYKKRVEKNSNLWHYD